MMKSEQELREKLKGLLAMDADKIFHLLETGGLPDSLMGSW
jgi:hypothetical protein